MSRDRSERIRPSRRRLLAGAFVFGSVGTGVLAVAFGGVTATSATGCTTHQCDPSSYDFFGPWILLDDNTIATTIWACTRRTIRGSRSTGPPPFAFGFRRRSAARTVLNVVPQVGTDLTPNGGDEFMPGDNWIYAIGQLAYFNFLQTGLEFVNSHGAFVAPDAAGGIAVGGGFSVANATCAPYFARFQINFAPEEPEAGADNPAGSLDASDLDAEIVDAAAADASTVDASTVDAWTVDASTVGDAGTD